MESTEKISGSVKDKIHYFLFSIDLNLVEKKKKKILSYPKQGN